METYFGPLFGGVLIGLSSTILLFGLGRIAGISGIVSSCLERPSRENVWRYSFIIGLLLGGMALQFLLPEVFDYSLQDKTLKLIFAGLLVGFGTRLGSGCTSGHGVCGLPRLSRRSVAATATFMFFGVLTVFIEGVLK